MIKQVEKSNQILVRLRSNHEHWDPTNFGIITIYDQWLETTEKACTVLEQSGIEYASMEILTGSLFCIDTDTDIFLDNGEIDSFVGKLEEFPVPCFVEADLSKLPGFGTEGTWTKVFNRDTIYIQTITKHTNVEIEISDPLTLNFLKNA